jgi:putative ABC transport system permease protein
MNGATRKVPIEMASMLGNLASDLRHALRFARRFPGSTASTVLIVAMAIGAAGALFGLLDALVLRPVSGVREPDRLVLISVGTGLHRTSLTVPALTELASRQHSLSSMCGWSRGALFRVEMAGGTTLNMMALSTGECAALLDVQTALGRFISADDDRNQDSAHVVVLGYGYWQRQFGGAADVVGRTIRIEGIDVTIIGVTARAFTGLEVEIATDIYLPVKLVRVIVPDPKRPPTANFALGRLRPGVSLQTARADIEAVWPPIRDGAELIGQSPSTVRMVKATRIEVAPAATGFSGLRQDYAGPLTVMTWIAGVLLLVACVNLSSLRLTHVGARQSEFFIRRALGADRPRLVQQVLAETLVPVIAGAVLAVPLDAWMSRTFVHAIWTGLALPTMSFAPDWRVLATAAAALVGIVAVISLAPAVAVGSSALSQMHGRVAAGHARRWSRPLIVCQVGLSLTLVFGGTLLVRSLERLRDLELGFQPDPVVEARLLPVTNGYDGMDAPTYYASLVETLATLPGVRSVALSHVFPAPIISDDVAARADAGPGLNETPIALEVVSPGFFDTVGIPLREGRDFVRADDRGAPVAIISAGLARALFPAGDAIGRFIRVGADRARARLEVIGVSGDPRLGDIRKPPTPAVFRPLNQEPTLARQPIVLVRTTGDPVSLVDPIRRTVASLKREYSFPGPMRTLISNEMLREQVLASVGAVCAVFALILSLVGLFALLAASVRRRAAEFGVRMALGASPQDVRRLIIREALVLVLFGIVVGSPIALLAGHTAQSSLFGVPASDPVALTGTIIAFLVAALLAAVVPARRASGVDPIEALRAQ